TQRTINNFKISGITFPINFLETLVTVKKVCAKVNGKLGEITSKEAQLIALAAEKIINDHLWDQFPLDIIQTGSGTQTNMNANEVLANLASKGEKEKIHWSIVNRGQSSNDIIPTAMNVSTSVAITKELIPQLKKLIEALKEKEEEFKAIIKIARTHLQDAVPMTMGQEFGTFAAQLKEIKRQIVMTLPSLYKLPVGGTAVGTGVNAHPLLAEEVCKELEKEYDIPFKPSENLFRQIAAHDELVTISGIIRTLAIALIKIANDIRWLASGPRCGLGELSLPANEPGSSIMPGKINPTQSEAMVQAGLMVMGNDHVVSLGGLYGGQLNLNTAKPIIIHSLLQSISILSNAMRSFTEKSVIGIKVNEDRIASLVEQSLMLATALTPYIGYDEASKLAKKAFEEGKTIRELALEEKILTEEELEKALDTSKMVGTK
ncbi:MAG: class II fumarate hydratase, partial [Candidatus Kariarchaeaceae archaeon]